MSDDLQISTNIATGGEGPATMDDVAASLIATPAPDEEQKKATPEPTPEPRQVQDTAQATDDSPDDAVNDPADPEPIDTDPTPSDPDPEPTPDPEDAEFDFLDLFDAEGSNDPDPVADGDDRTYTVKVDGEEVEVGINDLIRNYSAEGAIDKRLQDATETRSKASEEAQQLVEQAREMYDRVAQVYNHYNETLFSPRVAAPDPTMQDADPIGYVTAMEAYRQDQERIHAEKAQVEQVMQAASQQMAEQRRAFAQTEAAKLRTKIPKLNDPKARQAFKTEIVEIGRAHGFSDAEITDTADHRLLTMAAEAAAFRRLKARMQAKPVESLKQRKTPMSPTAQKRGGPKARAAQQRRRARERATNSGSVADVAATLII